MFIIYFETRKMTDTVIKYLYNAKLISGQSGKNINVTKI